MFVLAIHFIVLFAWFFYELLYLSMLQTDMMDLLGSDLPVDSDEGMKFAWSDGILLQVAISSKFLALSLSIVADNIVLFF